MNLDITKIVNDKLTQPEADGTIKKSIENSPEKTIVGAVASLTAPSIPESGERSLETIGAEIRDLTAGAKVSSIWYAVEIGRRLAEAKDKCGHGEWMPFLKQETEFSVRQAQRLMQVFTAYGSSLSDLPGAEPENTTKLSLLSYSQALALLALSEDDREEFVEANDIESMSTRELWQAIKERDEARKADTARLDGNPGDAEATAKQAAEELEEAKECADATEDPAKEEADRLKAQVKEPESLPVDVAVMAVDQEALEKVRAETVAEVQAKLDKAKDARQQAEAALAHAKDEARQAAEKAEAAAKQANIAGGEELANFEISFILGQNLANKMRGVRIKIRFDIDC